MFDDEYLNSIMNATKTIEDDYKTTFDPQTTYDQNTSVNFDTDDYSAAPNYIEQQTYNSLPRNSIMEEISDRSVNSKMDLPLIEREEPTVNLIKKRSKIRLETRMKIVLSVFTVIIACLMFITVFNFAEAGRLEASFGEKQHQIAVLRQSITDSNATYNLLSDDEYVKQWAEQNNYVEATDDNTIVVKLGEKYIEETVSEVPSNWFNDVCDFLSRLFA